VYTGSNTSSWQSGQQGVKSITDRLFIFFSLKIEVVEKKRSLHENIFILTESDMKNVFLDNFIIKKFIKNSKLDIYKMSKNAFWRSGFYKT
jgi:hypothetical protein